MSKIFIISVLILSLFLTISAQDLQKERRGLMPLPASVNWKSGRLNLTKNFAVAVKGKTDQRLKDYIFRAMRRLEGRTVMQFSRDVSENNETAQLLIETNSTGNAIPQLGDDESYKLELTDAQAKLTAPNTVGAMRGLETFLQLLEGDKDGFYFPAVAIDDKPRFAWRGLMIDSARHFMPLDVIKRNLDAMAAVKLNVLHWHLTEDQGFRVETKKFPGLYLQGSDGNFYTQDEIRGIINYAAARGIRVMPEFDMPGHATAWLVSHPEIGSGAKGQTYKIERLPGIFDPTLDPTNEKTYKILEPFFKEMAQLFPDKYLHIGGDENEGKQWKANAEIQAFMQEKGLKTQDDLQQYFNKRILKFIGKNGKIMMGWDEIFQPEIPKNIVIQSWRGQESLAKVARQGNQGILSNGYYIDLMQRAEQHYAIDPLPADTTLSADEQKRILGGEATMWSEWVSPETIDSRIWSRMPAIAERFWSPREVSDVDDMYRRLDVIGMQLEELGLTHRKNPLMLMRRLTNNQDISALQTLASVIEPVKGYLRYRVRKQNMLDPLTGLVDAANTDAKGAREFNKLVAAKNFAADSERINLIFQKWQTDGMNLQKIIENAPALSEAKQLAVDLQILGDIGLETAALMETGKTSSAEWRDAKLKRLDEIAKQKAALEFQVVEAMKVLINATAKN